MRMSQQQALELERLSKGRCPIHVRHNPGCSVCAAIVMDAAKGLPTRDRDVELESELQDQIENYCRNKYWPFVRSRMDKATTFTFPGVTDFVIAADGGRVFWIETKSKSGKQTTDQIGFQMLLNRCGHVYHLCRSYGQFLDIVKKETITIHPSAQPRKAPDSKEIN